MTVVITGGAGFLGQRLAAHAPASVAHSRRRTAPNVPIERLVISRRRACCSHRPIPGRARVDGGYRRTRRCCGGHRRHRPSIFHLAAIVSGMAEADFDLGMRINVDATRRSSRRAARWATAACRVHELGRGVRRRPAGRRCSTATALNPQTSYGTQKAIGELLLNDYSRRGFVDGRALRLPTITVRPGRPNAAASSFASGIIREPLNGEESVCPVDPDARLWLMSPATVVDCLIAAHDLPPDALGASRAVNLPGSRSPSARWSTRSGVSPGAEAAAARALGTDDPNRADGGGLAGRMGCLAGAVAGLSRRRFVRSDHSRLHARTAQPGAVNCLPCATPIRMM